MDNKLWKMRRIKLTAWIAFLLPFAAVGADRVQVDPQNDAKIEVKLVENEGLCGATGPSTSFTGYAAEKSDYYEQPSFVKDYFRNLVEHFPTNNCGNCGYTAVAMLLCYYDTYWSGKVIPDKFNSGPSYLDTLKDIKYSSPGVKDYAAPIYFDENVKKPDENATAKEIHDYNCYLVDEVYGPYLDKMRKGDLIKTNLISFLYDLALGNNKTKTVLWDFGINQPTTETYPIMITDLLNLYFNELGMNGLLKAVRMNYKDIRGPRGYLDPATQKAFLRNRAKRIILEGQPIIYRGDLVTDNGFYDDSQSYINGNGHMAIAYDYDREKDYIVGHIGWKGREEYSKVSFDEAFGDFTDFIYIDVDPDLEFDHGNSRFWAEGNYALACDLNSHLHADEEHRAKVNYGDPEYHALQCICGDVEYEEHFFDELASMNAQYHAHRCKCGATDGYEAHSYDEIEPCDAQYHALKCACGDVTYEEHSSEKAVYHDPQKHAYKCRCGEIVGYGFHYYFQTSLTTVKCGVCGDVKHIDPPFIINR